jgi:hypothetical protein
LFCRRGGNRLQSAARYIAAPAKQKRRILVAVVVYKQATPDGVCHGGHAVG